MGLALQGSQGNLSFQLFKSYLSFWHIVIIHVNTKLGSLGLNERTVVLQFDLMWKFLGISFRLDTGHYPVALCST